jgi:hypothetical protein
VRVCTLSPDKTKLLLLSHSFSNVMINSTSLNEANAIAREPDYHFLWPPDQKVSSPAKQIGTPVLPKQQYEALHRLGCHVNLP